MTLPKRLIPCLDIAAGRVVKGVNFVGLRDAGDPVELAQRYADAGADELAFLDITATHEQRDLLLPVIEAVASRVFIPLTVGGGVRTLEDVQRLLNAGADKISINSAAISTPELIGQIYSKYGAQCIVVALDAKRTATDTPQTPSPTEDHGLAADPTPSWTLFTHGGRRATGLDALEWAKAMVEWGAGEILLTSMDRDGSKTGFDLELTRTISDAVPIPVIASGGVGCLEHLVQGIQEGHADAVLAASIFHDGHYTLSEAKRFMAEHGIAVR